MKINYSQQFIKDFRKLQKSEQIRVSKKLKFYFGQQYPLSFAEKLTNKLPATHRFRVGDFCIIVKVQEDTIDFLILKHRKDVYKNI